MLAATKTSWNWTEAPFSTKPDPNRFYPAETQEEALSRLHFLVENRRRLGVLVGGGGAGKSMLQAVVAKQLRQQGRQVVATSLMGADTEELLWRVATGLGGNPRESASIRQLWRDIEDRIKANRYQRIDTVLLLDDVAEAEHDTLMAIARLIQLEMGEDTRLTVILGCRTDKLHLIGERLLDLCDLRVDLEPWSEDDMRSFVYHALAASACGNDLFSDEALTRLYELTGGVPRHVQQLAHLSLVAAAAQDLECVDEQVVDTVQDELSLQSVAEATWR